MRMVTRPSLVFGGRGRWFEPRGSRALVFRHWTADAVGICFSLHLGLSVLAIPYAFNVKAATKGYGPWKRRRTEAIYADRPRWMKSAAYGIVAYFIIVMIVFRITERGASTELTDPNVSLFFSGGWMTGYFLFLAIFYSAIRTATPLRRCPHGHVVPPAAAYCEECGGTIPLPEKQK